MFALSPVEDENRGPYVITTINQQGTERVNDWAFTGLLAPEIECPNYTFVDLLPVHPGGLIPAGRFNYERLNNLERETYYVVSDCETSSSCRLLVLTWAMTLGIHNRPSVRIMASTLRYPFSATPTTYEQTPINAISHVGPPTKA